MKITFLGLPDSPNPRVALVPIPFEHSTSWLKGTKFAPQEILKVSPNLEFFDEEFLVSPYRDLGFYTAPIVELPLEINQALLEIEAIAMEFAEKGMFAIYLGGEHTISLPVIKVYQRIYPNLKVIHLDAHLDQRDEYLGSKLNHATVVRRIKDLGVPVLSLGVRSLAEEEVEVFRRDREYVIQAKDFLFQEGEVLDRVRNFLGCGPSYLTLDVDAFDPAYAPGVGTPEPGGLNWYQVLSILKLFVHSRPVGMDIVELRPIPEQPLTEYLIARLILKTCAYLTKAEDELLSPTC